MSRHIPSARIGGTIVSDPLIPAVLLDIADAPLRDRVRWGPVVAGVVSAFAMLIFLVADIRLDADPHHRLWEADIMARCHSPPRQVSSITGRMGGAFD